MTVYVVSPADELNRMQAVAYPSRASATKAATRNDYVIENFADVRWSGHTLLQVYQALGGSRNRDFDTFDDGVIALLALLPRVAKQPVDGVVRQASVRRVPRG